MYKIILCLIFALTTMTAKTITDSLGRKVEIEKTPKTIVAIGAGTLRLLTYMGLDDKIIGVEKFEQRTADAKPYTVAIGKKKLDSLPMIGEGGKPGLLPNFEELISLKPDIIIVSVYTGFKNIDTIANKTNIPVLSLAYGKGKNFEQISYIDGANSSFKVLGEVFGKEKRANELILGTIKLRDELKNMQIKQNKSMYIGALRHKGQRGIIATDFTFFPFELLGLKNIFTGDKKVGSTFIQKEALLEKNPDIIFLDIGGLEKIKVDIAKDKDFYNSLKAFKNKNTIWLYHNNFYSTCLCNLILNAYVIADRLGHKKINIDDKANEIYTLFFKEKAKIVLDNYYYTTKKRFINW